MQSKKNNNNYGDQSIVMLKGPDRVRKRPAVIFGSDGLEGCEHSFFEILSNAGVSHFYTNRISYSFRNDGAFCLKKIFLKR